MSNFVNQSLPAGSSLAGSVDPATLSNDPALASLVASGADRNALIQHFQGLGINYDPNGQSAAGLLASGVDYLHPQFLSDPRFQRLSNIISPTVSANV